MPRPLARTRFALLGAALLLSTACSGPSTGEAPENPAPQPLAAAPDDRPGSNGLLAVNGTELYYRSIGSGDPIIVVHGGPGLNHTYLWPQLQFLAKTNRVIFYDQRICGQSDPDAPTGSITLQNFRQDLDALATALGLEQFHLIGHSWGGLLAMDYAVEHPERLQSLTLMSTVPASTAYKQQTDSMVQGRLTQEDLLERSNLVKSAAFRNGEPQAMEDFFRLSFRSVLHDRTMVDQIHLELPDNFGESSKKLGNLFEDLEQINLYPRLSAITCPALVVHGTADAVPLAAVERIAQAIPNSQLEVFSESGHFPYIEQPQAFQELMAQFLP